jgi:hypothetical protein
LAYLGVRFAKLCGKRPWQVWQPPVTLSESPGGN